MPSTKFPSSGTKAVYHGSMDYKTPESQTTNLSAMSSQSKSSVQGHPPHRTPFAHFINDIYRVECDTWAFEVLSIIVSLGALGTTVFALSYYDGKPAPEWPHSLTLNAFISVCTMVMGAALTVPVSNGLGQLKWLLARRQDVSVTELDTLDRASRGMWGSMCVIFGFTGGFQGSLGSIITILIFATAPFVQQSIFSSVGGIEVIRDPTTFITTCGPDSSVTSLCAETSTSGVTKKGQNAVPSLLRGGYYSAVYGHFNKSSAPSTLVTCPTGNCTWAPFTTLSLCGQCLDVSESLVYTESSTDWGRFAKLPGGPHLDTSFDFFSIGKTNNLSLLSNKRSDIDAPRIVETNATAFTFAVLEANNFTNVSAIECSLSMCVQLIEATFFNGVFNETIIQEFTENHINLVYLNKDQTVQSFNDYLSFEPLASANGTKYPPISVDKRQPACLQQIIEFDPREEITLTEMGLENIETMVHNMAISVGRGLRTVCANGTHLLGSSWDNVTLVRINWYWLILPIVVEFLGLFFFLWISISNKLSRTKIWKSSLVAALFHGPEFGDDSEIEGLFDMEETAGKMKVKLSHFVRGDGEELRSRLVRSELGL